MSDMPDPVSDIVDRCQSGDRLAQRELYDTFNAMLYRLALRMVGVNDASDLVQKIFMQVYRSIGKFNGMSKFQTWLYRLAVNECLQHRRSTSRRPAEAITHDPPARNSQSGNERVEHRELLEVALQRVDADLSSIFLLREVEQLSYSEIASVLNISEGTVASRLNRARRALRDMLVELGWEA